MGSADQGEGGKEREKEEDAMDVEVEDDRPDLRKRLSASVSAMRYEKNDRLDVPEKDKEKDEQVERCDEGEKRGEGEKASPKPSNEAAAMDESP